MLHHREDRRYGFESGYGPNIGASWSQNEPASAPSGGYGGGAPRLVILNIFLMTRELTFSKIDYREEFPTQPPMMSFKAFLAAHDDSISDEEAVKKYAEYKLEFRRQQLNEFFTSHKDEEW